MQLQIILNFIVISLGLCPECAGQDTGYLGPVVYSASRGMGKAKMEF